MTAESILLPCSRYATVSVNLGVSVACGAHNRLAQETCQDFLKIIYFHVEGRFSTKMLDSAENRDKICGLKGVEVAIFFYDFVYSLSETRR